MIRQDVQRVFVAVTLAGGLILASGCQRSPAPTEPAATPAVDPVTASPPMPEAAPHTASRDDAPPEGVLRAYVWECDDGRTLHMRNLFREHAIAIDLHEGTQRLDHVVSASGARYANPDESIVFWTKGSSATLERKGVQPVQCAERRALSLREDARLRGVVYRAQGNEPGWTLEVGPGNTIDWTTNFGEERHAFDGVVGAAAPAGAEGRIFTATNGAQSIQVTLTKAPCMDDSGAPFEWTAVIESAGGTLRGCGVRLN